MVVLGIDPGTATTGYGVVSDTDSGSLQAIRYGVILTPADMPMSERLLILFHQMKELLLLHQPDSGAVEPSAS